MKHRTFCHILRGIHMRQLDRILGILLVLQSKRSVSATQLAQQLEVSTRTIYRDLQTLDALGVPIYTTRGHGGGIRLLEGYFLPPLMFSRDEAIALFLGLTFLRSLHAIPFSAEVETASQKLLVALPASLKAILMQAEHMIGFEHLPNDIFHPELSKPTAHTNMLSNENHILSTFLRAILDQAAIHVQYESPYRPQEIQEVKATPLGLFWDRNHWYLVGKEHTGNVVIRQWRADRVQHMVIASTTNTQTVFDIQDFLGRKWLQSAMKQWQHNALVVIRLTQLQVERLKQDWYYRHATFEEVADNQFIMMLGEDNQIVILELLRWLGPGAELMEPKAWREQMKEDLHRMLAIYEHEG